MPATLHHGADKVQLTGVTGFDASQCVSSVHGVQARILQSLSIPLTYDDLICYSAFAFRIQAHESFCPSAGHPGPGYTCLENSNRAIPWQIRFFDANPWDPPRTDRAALEIEACAAIRQSIDRGIPVHYGSEEDGLIIGYTDAGRRWWCIHPYYKAGKEPFWHDQIQPQGMDGFAGGKWPWGIAVWTEPKPADQCIAPRDLLIIALRQAVEMWHTEKRHAYFCGDAAYAHWLNWLAGIDAGKVPDPKAGMRGNGWCFDVLTHCRRIAGSWLTQHAAEFASPARQQLLIAADHYTRLSAECLTGLQCPWDLAPGPDKFDQWTPAMRRDQIARLTRARAHDDAAVVAIEQTLNALTPGN